jgi:dihydrofolate reductase
MMAIRIEGYAIVSADGMLADMHGVMPPSLKIGADQRFFEAALDRADLIVHGRNSHEDQANSPRRGRVVATRAVSSLARDEANPKAVLWNPASARFEDALTFADVRDGIVAVIGGTGIFSMFLPRYDTFWLSLAPHARLPGGVPVFHGVPEKSPQSVLAEYGLRAEAPVMLDATTGVTVTPWRR